MNPVRRWERPDLLREERKKSPNEVQILQMSPAGRSPKTIKPFPCLRRVP